MEEESDVKASRRPKDTPFSQQRMPSRIVLITPRTAIIIFLVIGIIFIPLGAGFLHSSNSVLQVSARYDDRCAEGAVCNITLTVPQLMKAPVYLYYGLDGYYQNHRRYVDSRDDVQLRGGVESYSNLLENCVIYVSQGGSSNLSLSYLPCGLIARSLFNDTFEMFSHANGSSIPVTLRKDGIAWTSDKTKRFRNPGPEVHGIRIIPDFTDEDFIVWMQVSGLPNFKKLYRIIDSNVPAGNYTFRIESNYPVAVFGGHKQIFLSTMSWMGGKNPFLGGIYLGFGLLCLIQGIVFALKQRFAPGRTFADKDYLDGK